MGSIHVPFGRWFGVWQELVRQGHLFGVESWMEVGVGEVKREGWRDGRMDGQVGEGMTVCLMVG